VGGDLERRQRLDVQLVVDAPRQHWTDAGNRPEQGDGIGPPAQALELAPASRPHQLVDDGRDPSADRGQGVEAGDAVTREDLAEVPRKAVDRVRRASKRADPEGARRLFLQQRRRFPQPLRHDAVALDVADLGGRPCRRRRPGASSPRG
jgi:hypothetical protein